MKIGHTVQFSGYSSKGRVSKMCRKRRRGEINKRGNEKKRVKTMLVCIYRDESSALQFVGQCRQRRVGVARHLGRVFQQRPRLRPRRCDASVRSADVQTRRAPLQWLFYTVICSGDFFNFLLFLIYLWLFGCGTKSVGAGLDLGL